MPSVPVLSMLCQELRIEYLIAMIVWTPLIPATMNSKAQDHFTSPMGRPGQPCEVATCFCLLGWTGQQLYIWAEFASQWWYHCWELSLDRLSCCGRMLDKMDGRQVFQVIAKVLEYNERHSMEKKESSSG